MVHVDGNIPVLVPHGLLGVDADFDEVVLPFDVGVADDGEFLLRLLRVVFPHEDVSVFVFLVDIPAMFRHGTPDIILAGEGTGCVLFCVDAFLRDRVDECFAVYHDFLLWYG